MGNCNQHGTIFTLFCIQNLTNLSLQYNITEGNNGKSKVTYSKGLGLLYNIDLVINKLSFSDHDNYIWWLVDLFMVTIIKMFVYYETYPELCLVGLSFVVFGLYFH